MISAPQLIMIIALFGFFMLLAFGGAAFAVYKSRNPDGLPFVSSPFKKKDLKPQSYMGDMFQEDANDTEDELSPAAERIRTQGTLPHALAVATGKDN